MYFIIFVSLCATQGSMEVSAVYKAVIGDVIEKMALEFAQQGVDETILQELQQAWESKLAASQVVNMKQPVPYTHADYVVDSRLPFAPQRSDFYFNQTDGNDDDDEEEDDFDDDEQDINSELDDEESEGEADADHIVLCQYEKVTRIKNKWKATFRDGVMTVNGKDYLFNKGTGEFEW